MALQIGAFQQKKSEKNNEEWLDILSNLFVTIVEGFFCDSFQDAVSYIKYLKFDYVSLLTVSWMPAYCI